MYYTKIILIRILMNTRMNKYTYIRVPCDKMYIVELLQRAPFLKGKADSSALCSAAMR